MIRNESKEQYLVRGYIDAENKCVRKASSLDEALHIADEDMDNRAFYRIEIERIRTNIERKTIMVHEICANAHNA